LDDIKIIRLGWAGHFIRMEEEMIPKDYYWEIPQHRNNKKNKMGGRRPDCCIIGSKSTRWEERPGSRRESSTIRGWMDPVFEYTQPTFSP
jgi:hypothetical protein